MKYGMPLLVYIDGFIIIAESEARIYVLTHSLKNDKDKYMLTEEGSIDKFLKISIIKLDDNQYKLAQPLLIELIIELIEIECPTKLNGKQ